MSIAAAPLRNLFRVAFQRAALTLALGLVALALCAFPAAHAQIAMRSPEQVKSALVVLSRVVDESSRSIAEHRYDQLPHESNEFEAGLTALEQGLGNPPSALKAKLEPLVGKARIASSAMSEAVEAHRDSMLGVAHRQLADAVSEIIASFPPDLRPRTGG